MDERLQQARLGGGRERQQVRYWSANSSDVEFDRQGRFALPSAIREYGRLQGEVLIVGAIDHVELWDPAIYDQQVNAAEEIFRRGEIE
jgi:MraZ protein